MTQAQAVIETIDKLGGMDQGTLIRPEIRKETTKQNHKRVTNMGTYCPHFCTQNCGIMRAKEYIAQNSDSIGHLAEVIYALRCNFFTLKAGRGQHSKYLPFAFTREGIAMLSGLLRSEIAVQARHSPHGIT